MGPLIPIAAGLKTALPSIIAGGAQLIGQGINALSQARANRQQLKYAQQTYQQQRKDSLADWEMQNKYGSPEQQMQRLKEAGLNPHLVYGKGTIDNFAGAVRSSDAKNYSPIAPKLDMSAIGDSIGQIADLKLKQAQTDNLRNSIEVSQEQKALIIAQALKTAKDTDYTVFKTMRDQMLLPITADGMKANINQTLANTKSTTDGNNRANTLQNTMLEPNKLLVLAQIDKLRSDMMTNTTNRQLVNANINKLIAETSKIQLDTNQARIVNDLIQESMLLDNQTKMDNKYINQARLQLEQANFDRGYIDIFIKLLQTVK